MFEYKYIRYVLCIYTEELIYSRKAVHTVQMWQTFFFVCLFLNWHDATGDLSKIYCCYKQKMHSTCFR